MTKREKVYVIHFCKNKLCNQAWIDVDKYNAQVPPRWRYCPLCRPVFRPAKARRRAK